MLIGALVKKTGLTKETIRHYQALGLVRGLKTQANGYKIYSEQIAADMLLITMAKNLGFTLKEIKSLVLLLHQGQLNRKNMNEAFEKKIDEIDSKIKDLSSIKKRLLVELKKECTPGR